jgi:Tol biopolymer transport system component
MAPNGSGNRILDVTQTGSLSWSGDGGRVAFANAQSQVVAARADGSGSRVLTLTATSGATPDFHDGNVSWQPTGNKILFIRGVGDAGHPERLGIVDADSGAEKILVTRYGVEAACWSPDGRWIAYVGVDARTGNPSSVWVVRSDGSSNHRIASFPPDALTPYAVAWRPTTT